jgi:hypothetical protein
MSRCDRSSFSGCSSSSSSSLLSSASPFAFCTPFPVGGADAKEGASRAGELKDAGRLASSLGRLAAGGEGVDIRAGGRSGKKQVGVVTQLWWVEQILIGELGESWRRQVTRSAAWACVSGARVLLVVMWVAMME